MKFNISNANTTAVQRIAPFTISKVAFKGIEAKEGKSKEGREWKAFQIKFDGESGVFDTMFFCPDAKGEERMSGDTGTYKWVMPSAMEQLIFNVAHFLSVVAPENYEKIKGKLNLELPAEFDKLVEVLVKATNSSIDKEFYIKVVANNKGYASLPNSVQINTKTDEAFFSNNWISANESELKFTARELKAKDALANTRPTVMPDDLEDDSKTDDTDDLELDDL